MRKISRMRALQLACVTLTFCFLGVGHVRGQSSVPAGSSGNPASTAEQIQLGVPPAITPKIRDFNADGKDDVVWLNTSNGAAAVWLMNGLGTLAQAVVYAGGPYRVSN